MQLPNFSRLRLGTDEMARTSGFYSLTPNEADQLIAQRERDPVSLDEFFSVFRVSIPSSDGTMLYRYFRADVLWRSIQSVYAQKNELVYPDIQAPVWYEDWYELHNQYDPNGPVPPEVNQLLRLADYNPAAPPAWALPTPAPPAPAPAPAAPVVAPEAITLEQAWRAALDRAGHLGEDHALPEPGLPIDNDLQANVLNDMLHNLQGPLSAYSAQPNDDRAMAIVRDYLNNGVYEIFEAHAWQFFQYEGEYNHLLSAVVSTMVSIFVANPEPPIPREMVRAILMFLSTCSSPSVEDGFFPIAQPQRREVNEQLRGWLFAWERVWAVRWLSQDRKLQFAVDRLLGRNAVSFADPLDSRASDEPYPGPTQEEREWRLQQTGMRATLHDPLVALIGALHRNHSPPPGETVDDEELQRALDAVPFPLPTDGHNRRNPWSFIFASSDANRTLESDAHPHRFIWMLMAWVEAERNVFNNVKLMICAFLNRYVVAYPEVGRAINTHNVKFRHEVRALAARQLRQMAQYPSINQDHVEAAYELAAYLQMDHDDWLLNKGVERAVNTGLSGALNSAVRRQQRNLAAAQEDPIVPAPHLTAYKRAWEDERRLKARISLLWRGFERRATVRPDHNQGILLPYLRASLHDDLLLTASGWSQERVIAKLREWIAYQTTRGEGGEVGMAAAQGIIDDLLAYAATQQQAGAAAARARPGGEATPGRRRQRT